jgi:hypothetical protein
MLLAGIRLVNGSIALFARRIFIGNLGSDVAQNPAAVYAFRMFGIRTILVALELLWPKAEVRARAVKQAPIIHASDTVAAFLASRSALVPHRAGVTIVIISSFNTLLSLVIQKR